MRFRKTRGWRGRVPRDVRFRKTTFSCGDFQKSVKIVCLSNLYFKVDLWWFLKIILQFHVDHRSAYTCGSEGDPCYNSDNDRKFKSTCIHKGNTNRTFAITFGSSEYSIVTCWYLSHVHLPLCVYPANTVS